MTEANCPYCLSILAKVPSRKAKCPNCGEVILIRDGKMVTEKEAKRIDERWKILGALKDFNILEPEFNRLVEEQRNKLNADPDPIELILSIAIEQAGRIKNLEALEMHLDKLAYSLNKAGKEYRDYQVKARLTSLNHLKQNGAKTVKISASVTSCPNCLESKNKILPIDEAIATMPLPNKLCTRFLFDPTRGFCDCRYDLADEIVVDIGKLYEASKAAGTKRSFFSRFFKT
jgi:uncharacterized Zn finger protein (UPF0148 family)